MTIDLTEIQDDRERYQAWLEQAKDRNETEQYRNEVNQRIGIDFITMQPRYVDSKVFDPNTTYLKFDRVGSFILDLSRGLLCPMSVHGGEYPEYIWPFINRPFDDAEIKKLLKLAKNIE